MSVKAFRIGFYLFSSEAVEMRNVRVDCRVTLSMLRVEERKKFPVSLISVSEPETQSV